MVSIKDMYQFARDDSSFLMGVASSYLLAWVVFANQDSAVHKGPIDWMLSYLTQVGISIPGWIQKVLLSPRPDIWLMMLFASLALAYCIHLLPLVLIACIQWHGLGATSLGYLLALAVLSLLTGLIASMASDSLGPRYAVQAKVLFPGMAVPMYPVFVILGMFEKFTQPADGAPTLPADLDLLERKTIQDLTGAELVRAMRVASDSRYAIPPIRRKPVTLMSS